MNLYKHQIEGIAFLGSRRAAMLCDEQGTGKTRQALCAAQEMFIHREIDRCLVLCPAAVRYAWSEEMRKLKEEAGVLPGGEIFNCGTYDPKTSKINGVSAINALAITVISYSILPRFVHVEALVAWCRQGNTLLICDESSFLKNRAAKQTQGALEISRACAYRWLLSGTPVANSQLDLYSQGKVMAPTGGPLGKFKNFYSFRAAYGYMGGFKMKQWFADEERCKDLTKRFAPYCLRRLKTDCLDLPPKVYQVREVALDAETWRVYQELKRDCLLALRGQEEVPEPNAAVRILRLSQITSGHVGNFVRLGDTRTSDILDDGITITVGENQEVIGDVSCGTKDISSEKLSWLVEQLTEGELSSEPAVIVWCRWRRERERLAELLKDIAVTQIHGGQSQKERDMNITEFQSKSPRRVVMLAQPHAGGYGLTLTAAATAVYLSNDYSYVTRVQSEDRCHRMGQTRSVNYVDILATGPKGQRTIDHAILEALRKKEDIARWTVAAWRKVLE